jgi:spermidine synthase
MRPRRIPFSYYFLTGIIGVTASIIFPAMIRQLTLVFGIHLLSFVLILAALFLSLSAGAFFNGRIADRIKSPVTAYFILSILFIVFLLFHHLIPDFLTGKLIDYSTGKFRLVILRFFVSILYFFIPAFVVAGTMPLLLRIYIRNLGEAGMFVSSALMSVSCGALLLIVSALPLISRFGLASMNYLAVFVFTISTGFSFLIFRQIKKKALLKANEPSSIQKQRPLRFRKKKVILEAGAKLTRALLYGSVFQTFAFTSMLILSFRILIRHNEISLPVFYVVNIIVVLLGLIAGSLFYKKTAEKTVNKFLSLATLQIFSGFASLISFAVLHIFLLKTLQELVPDNFPSLVLKQVLFSGILLFVPSLLYGISFPVAGRLYPKRFRLIATNTGKLAGLVFLSIIAALFLTPYLIIPVAGIELSFILFSLILLLSGVYLIFRDSRLIRGFRFGYGFVVTVLFVLIAAFLYISDFRKINETTDLNEEGSTASVNVISEKDGKMLYLNNTYYVGTDLDGRKEQILSAIIPLALQPEIKTALVMGFGTGITPNVLDQLGLTTIHITEEFPEIIRASSYVFSNENNDVLSSPEVETDIEDARSYLNRTDKKFDLIASGSQQLFQFPGRFTREFYQLAYMRLSDKGILCQIIPFHDLSTGDFLLTLRTANSVFSATSIWYLAPDRLLMVSCKDQPAIDFCELKTFTAKLNRKGVLLQAGVINAEDLIGRYFMNEKNIPRVFDKMQVKTDDTPFLQIETFKKDTGVVRSFFTEVPDFSKLLVFGSGCLEDSSSVLSKIKTVNRSLLEQSGESSLPKKKHVVDFFESNAALIQRYL